jgi:hypothetical protein
MRIYVRGIKKLFNLDVGNCPEMCLLDGAACKRGGWVVAVADCQRRKTASLLGS